MKKINIYKIGSIITFVIGLGFSYLIADLNDAPGVVILGFGIATFFL